ncbi:MAG: hypothetical protein WCG27_02145 [Pseudomonadota bacterium]
MSHLKTKKAHTFKVLGLVEKFKISKKLRKRWSTFIPLVRTFFLQDPFLELNILKGFSASPENLGGKK